MKKFEILDISGDAGIRAFGSDPNELFVNTALGMYNLITDLNSVGENKTLEISSEGSSLSGLLVSFLNELVFHFDAYGFIGKSMTVSIKDNRSVSATIHGEEFDPQRHERGLLIKAATYHRLSIEQKDGGWHAEVVFDI